MMLAFQTKTRVIGLDIGRVTIKAAQITLHDKGPRLDGCVSVSRSSPGYSLDRSEAQRLLRVLERRGLNASQVVLIAPTDALVGGSMSVPPAGSGVSREKIVEMELSRTHKLSPGSFEMAWWDLPVPASGSYLGQAHALGLPHSAVQVTLQSLSELGLGVARTVPASLALLASAQRYPIDPRCIAAVLDLGSTRGHLSLMYAGRVVHERSLPDFSMKKISEAASELLGVQRDVAEHALSRFGLSDNPDGMVVCETTSLLSEAVQPLAEEIGMSFAYVSHLYPEAELGHLLLAGGGANVLGLDAALTTILELKTGLLTPEKLLKCETAKQDCDDPALAIALGAALCGEVSS